MLTENFFIRGGHLYIVDPRQYVIHKYDRDGSVVSTLKYEDLLVQQDRGGSGGPPPPPEPILDDNNNHPYITLKGNVLLPAHKGGETLFELRDWQGNHLADIGEIPEGYDPMQERERIRAAVANRQVPRTDLHQAFPVSDRSNPGELFMVYSAIPKIAKYDMSGHKLWEREIPDTPEIDSLVSDLVYVMNEYNYRNAPRHRKYVWGTSSPAGDLYLSTYTNSSNPKSHRPLWIHQFSSEGELIRRYKLQSEDELSYFPSIDHSGRRIFTILKEGLEIRAYTF
ncbi:hypothetical protein NC796_22045 [Aliifodinibius sp. S!AR15-10]|uniref:hypothetical protein n=1 Tax=Aliifodinibius sp. S!AR15-10 TaxID=2950437 RepID=UPI00285B33D2|nr:hypothetical protein [Aliifodinibius sp. S!AR15-10]MDR8393851.1 hypothetical protein [Aliifodinibius sp. S!AR15-10]